MNEYLLSTNGMSNRKFKVGETLYGKIVKESYTNRDLIYMYDKYSKPNIDSPYGVISGTTKNKRDNIVTELLKLKFNQSQRALFNVISVKDDVVIVFDSVEKDNEEVEHAFSYVRRLEYNDLYYIKQDIGITIVGFRDNEDDIIIPSKINGTCVIGIGNYNEFGIPIELIGNINNRQIIINDGIKIIDDYAFMGQNISKITFPKTLQYLGKCSFYESKVDEIDLSNTEIDSIEEYCFAFSFIKHLIMPNELSSFRYRSFYNTEIENIEMPNYLYTIEKDVFKNCSFEKIINNCQIEYVDIGNKIKDDNLKIECIKLKEYENIQLKIIGYLAANDLEEDKIAEAAYGSEYEEIDVEKIVYFLEDNKQQKYEFVISKYEDQDFEDDELSYRNYIRSISCNCYKVNEFKIDRHFNYPDFDVLYRTFKCPKQDEYHEIKIRYTDIEKIAGITINEEYKYLFDDLVLSKSNGQELKPCKEFIDYLLNDKNLEDIDESILGKIKSEEKRYMLFKDIKSN